jgi:hypothetical protein
MVLTWGSEGVDEGSAEVDGWLLGMELGFDDKLGDSLGNSELGLEEGC